MSANSASVEPDPGQDNVVLLYDYSKHLLSLSLLGIGGIVSLAQSPQGQKIPGLIVSMMLGALALSGFCALSCSASILRARERDVAVGRGAWLSSRLAMMFLGIGVGGFLIIWIETLL
ncbi:hypothetical protein ASE86_05625 [Sphingomonas sp. Leaf33]|uniref:hypothetical protein n=1 Tax=Sphingomonas sp. Leaf33 TaxID=1736215 RepID=UPI0007006E5C|nr:hypothetical protein [Sphingomonas sp. Leaf33]KQN25688.1 hypothetical protein ASE86_05625 [Sphingomonas sp. Leaf33]